MTKTTTNLLHSVLIALVLTSVSYLTGIFLGWISIGDINWIEVLAVFTSYSCTWLCVVQSRWNYPIGAVSTALLAVMFYQYGLFASMALNIYLIPTLIYGWFRWRPDEITRPVTSVFNDNYKWVVGYLLLTIVGYISVLTINDMFGAKSPLLDTAILTLSILAQFLLDNKRIETWFVWATVNVIALYVYFNSGLYLVFFQYIFFLVNTVIGYISWRSTYVQR